MTFGRPPYERTVVLPSMATWKYAGAVLMVLGSLSGGIAAGIAWGFKMTLAPVVLKVDGLGTAIAAMKELPARVEALSQHISDDERRISGLEGEARARDGRYAEIKTTLQRLGDGLDTAILNMGDMKAALHDVTQREANLLDAVTGQTYIGPNGKRVR